MNNSMGFDHFTAAVLSGKRRSYTWAELRNGFFRAPTNELARAEMEEWAKKHGITISTELRVVQGREELHVYFIPPRHRKSDPRTT